MKRIPTDKTTAEKLCAALWGVRRSRLAWTTMHPRVKGARPALVLFDCYAPHRRFTSYSEPEIRREVEREVRAIVRKLRGLGIIEPRSRRPSTPARKGS